MKNHLQILTKNEQEVLENYRKELSAFKANRNFVKHYLKRFLGKRYIECYEDSGYKAITLYKITNIVVEKGYIYLKGFSKSIDLSNNIRYISLCTYWIKSNTSSLNLEYLKCLKEISLEKYKLILKNHSNYLNNLNHLIK